MGAAAAVLCALAGGAWLSLAPGPSILWARLGGVLVLSLTAIWSIAVLAEENPWKEIEKKGDAKEGAAEAAWTAALGAPAPRVPRGM